MVDPLLAGCSTAGKPCSTLFHRLHPDLPGISTHGVAQNWAVDYDVQVTLMGIVIETGSSTIADLAAALPGHPAPVAAIMALVDAGHLSRAPGVLTPFTSIFCGRDIESKSQFRREDTPRPPLMKRPSPSKTLIAFPIERQSKSGLRPHSTSADSLESKRPVRRASLFEKRRAYFFALAFAKALWTRPRGLARSIAGTRLAGAPS